MVLLQSTYCLHCSEQLEYCGLETHQQGIGLYNELADYKLTVGRY